MHNQDTIGRITGYTDRNLVPIKVGDQMILPKHAYSSCCEHPIRCTVTWNTEWAAYGLQADNGEWISGMGIVIGLLVESSERKRCTHGIHEENPCWQCDEARGDSQRDVVAAVDSTLNFQTAPYDALCGCVSVLLSGTMGYRFDNGPRPALTQRLIEQGTGSRIVCANCPICDGSGLTPPVTPQAPHAKGTTDA